MSRRTFWEVRLMSGYTCNPRYNTPSPDVLRKLELSRLEAENIETREMRCPICGFLVRIIPVTQTDIVFVKCRKCKFDGALSPAYFRRIRNCRGTRIFRKVRSASSGTTGSYRNAWQPESVRIIQKDLSPARRRSAVSRSPKRRLQNRTGIWGRRIC